MAARRTPVHPLAAMDAARAAVAAKADRAPETLTADDLKLLRGPKILELGNSGRLRHLGLGLPLKLTAPPKRGASRPNPYVTDEQLKTMTGTEISRAMAAGRVPGFGARRRGRRH